MIFHEKTAVLISFTFVFMRNVFIAVFNCLFLCQCANIVPPNGGVKDNSPPILLNVEEEEQFIRLIFDENIQLKNQSDFYCSPPLPSAPKLKTQRNQLVIEGNWQQGTSYSLHFPSVIADYNEGNLIEKLNINFPNISADTLSFSGNIKNALQKKASKDVWAALYINNMSSPDSALLLSIPDYIAKSDENGCFFFPNLIDTTYWLFALCDEDRNLKYNLPEENVGFYPQAIKPSKSELEIILFNENTILDSLTLQKIDSSSVFGRLTIDSLPANHIVELLQNDKVVKRSMSKEPMIMDSLLVGVYEIRIIHDENENGIWDTGVFLERKQAEAISYYPEKIQLREDWDLEINWKE